MIINWYLMSSASEAQTISAFPPVRNAPLPRVVLLYNTSVTYSERVQTLSIHQKLPAKVRYHPYNHAKLNSTPRVIMSSSSPSNPTSIAPFVIPPPHGSLTVANSGWDVSTTKAYRVCIHCIIFYRRSSPIIENCKGGGQIAAGHSQTTQWSACWSSWESSGYGEFVQSIVWHFIDQFIDRRNVYWTQDSWGPLGSWHTSSWPIEKCKGYGK